MVFSTIIFLCAFLPLTIIGYYLLPKKAKNIWLLLCSVFFYAWGEPKFVLVMLLSILCNYIFGILIAGCGQDEKKRGRKKIVLILSVITNLGLLFVFKYFTFVMESIKLITKGSFDVIQIALPIGISFYTFQGMSYVVDVYRQEGMMDESGQKVTIVQKNILNLALYIAMFPQLIAGPIVRYHDIKDSLVNRSHTPEKFASGVERFIVGLAKKAILANMIGSLANSIMTGDLERMGATVAWLGAIAYTLQIYFDFSGYSDMAIGLGRIFGFEFMENFNYPYISKSIKEFWRRWHISLSGWFRDYLYIPLGGSRRGNVYVNLGLVFLATGIWHGAAFTFILWGIYHGVFRLSEYWLEKHVKNAPKGIVLSFAGWIYTTVVVIVGWVIFAQNTVAEALYYIGIMFGIKRNAFQAFDVSYYLNHQMTFYLVLGILFCIPWKEVLKKLAPNVQIKSGLSLMISIGKRVLLLGLLVVCYVYIINSSFNPFIYFRF